MNLAAGNASAAWEAYETARERTAMDPMTSSIFTWAALAPLMSGDLAAAGRWADDAVSSNTGWALAAALTSRARVEIARGELDAAERDAYDALDLAARLGGDLVVPFALDCLAIVAGEAGNDLLAARLFGAADATRRRMGMVRFKVLDADDEARIATVRDAWARTNSTPRGRKARRCRSRRRSPTRSVVVANAGAPAAVGRR